MNDEATYVQVPLFGFASPDVRALAALDHVLNCFPMFVCSETEGIDEFRCRVVKMLAEKYLGEYCIGGPKR